MHNRNYLLENQQHTIVTPTQAMARQLQQDYVALQLEAGNKSWESPRIYSWSALLKHLHQQCLNKTGTTVRLLNQRQQYYLWQQIIR